MVDSRHPTVPAIVDLTLLRMMRVKEDEYPSTGNTGGGEREVETPRAIIAYDNFAWRPKN